MPTYKNVGTGRVTWPDKTYISMDPGEVRSFPFYLKEHPDIELVSDDPPLQPPVLGYWEAELVPGELLELKMGYAPEYELSIFARKGSCLVAVGVGGPKSLVDTSSYHVSTYAWDMAPKITLEGVSDGIFVVKQNIKRPMGDTRGN